MNDNVASDASVSPIERTYSGVEGYDSEEDIEYYENKESETQEDSESGYTEESTEEDHSTPVNLSDRKQNTDKILSGCASEVRCRILQNEVYVLKTERSVWAEREQELLDRLQITRDNLRKQHKKLLEEQLKVQELSQEIDLIDSRSKLRQRTLENSYRTLCENVRLAEEASFRARIELRRLQTRNLVLEELLRSKGLAYDKLDIKVRDIMSSFTGGSDGHDASHTGCMSTSDGSDAAGIDVQLHNGAEVNSVDVRGNATPMSTDRDETSNMNEVNPSTNEDNRLSSDGNGLKAADRIVLGGPSEVNEVGIPLLEAMESRDGETAEVCGLAQLMKTHIRQMIACSKESERQMLKAVDIQIEELKEMLQQTRADLSYKTEECNKLTRSLENMRGELEITKTSLSQNLEVQTQIKNRYQQKVLEVESLQRDLEEMEAQFAEAKRELEASRLREKQNKATFDEYMNETDAKLFKMELMLSANVKDIDTLDATNQKGGSSEKIDSCGKGTDESSNESGNTKGQKEKAETSVAYVEYEQKLSLVKEEYEKQLLDLKQKCQQLTEEAERRSSEAAATKTIKIDIPEAEQQSNEGYVKVTQEYMVKMLKKEALLTDKLKEEVVKCYKLNKRVEQLEAHVKRICICRKSLKHVEATKTKRCWCRFKRIPELRKNIATASLKRDASVIESVICGKTLAKRRRGTQNE
ncbi:hypothetical protein X943_003402 [Babesia divergens]|uniref:Uncharacterized protein n=1 Tax=Babesia divergens TaxID=32595 RepID=A0AAD9GHV7_BABDI|nr:hypothetical protein X943_003402 [Babesia divergens]